MGAPLWAGAAVLSAGVVVFTERHIVPVYQVGLIGLAVAVVIGAIAYLL